MANVTINNIPNEINTLQDSDIFIAWDDSQASTGQVPASVLKDFIISSENLTSISDVNGIITTSTYIQEIINWIKDFYTATENNQGTITLPSTSEYSWWTEE